MDSDIVTVRALAGEDLVVRRDGRAGALAVLVRPCPPASGEPKPRLDQRLGQTNQPKASTEEAPQGRTHTWRPLQPRGGTARRPGLVTGCQVRSRNLGAVPVVTGTPCSAGVAQSEGARPRPGRLFALLYWTFSSALNATLILANVPFSIIGGIGALYVRGIPFSVSAAVGFVSLFGVAVMSGVLYVAEINRQRFDYDRPLKEAVLVGACVQFRPLLILILVAMLGMVPAAFAKDIGSDIQRPLATVILGGLVSTLFLTLLALPCLYYLAERHRR